MSPIYLGLGSNIDPETNLKKAAALLTAHWPTIQFSKVYRSAAQEHTDQADFLNAVAQIDTDESVEQVQSVLQSIEQTLKKELPFRFGPRTIDLDILMAGDAVVDTATLTLPHPRMHTRRFVLQPLLELLSPHTEHPRLHVFFEALLEATAEQVIEAVELELG